MKLLVGQIKIVCRMKENVGSRNVNFMFHYSYVVRSVLFSSIELWA